MFRDIVETQFDEDILDIIDEDYRVNGTKHHMPFIANVTLDWSCEKDSIVLNMADVLSALINGTFYNELDPKPT